MNTFMKNFGIILIILGVLVLAYYAMENPVSNATLIVAGILMIGGIAGHIIFNRIFD